MRKQEIIINGQTRLIESSLLADGGIYPKDCYLEADVNGFYAKDDVKLQEVAILKAKADGEAVMVAHIQEPIETYNLANGIVFSDVHNCANYKTEADYIHQPFCLKAWNFNVAVWKSGREQQDLIFSGTIPMPTAEEFKAMLPVWVD